MEISPAALSYSLPKPTICICRLSRSAGKKMVEVRMPVGTFSFDSFFFGQFLQHQRGSSNVEELPGKSQHLAGWQVHVGILGQGTSRKNCTALAPMN